MDGTQSRWLWQMKFSKLGEFTRPFFTFTIVAGANFDSLCANSRTGFLLKICDKYYFRFLLTGLELRRIVLLCL